MATVANPVVVTAQAPKLPLSKIAWGTAIVAIFMTIVHLSNIPPKDPNKGRFELEPGESSLHLMVGKGETYSFTHGPGIEIHCVYSDGTDMAYPCISGPIIEQYARNSSDGKALVTYKQVLPTN